MMNIVEKYKGVVPAFYACYNQDGTVSKERIANLAIHLVNKGVAGLYMCGSSGECIYQSKEERKLALETVMQAVGGKTTIIAHVACNNTADSMELAAHAESLGVDAIAAIPPIYFRLPEEDIARYWNDISSAAPKTDFIIYNIPQLAGVALTLPLLRTMIKNPRMVGVKNSSMATHDIQAFKAELGKDKVVFNGPDEQFVSGLAIGANGGIGGTYAVMPELFMAIERHMQAGENTKACEVQVAVNEIISAMLACEGNLYAVMKAILHKRENVVCGSVRRPLAPITAQSVPQIELCARMIDAAIANL